VFRRCGRCNRALPIDERARRCLKCGGERFSWAYVVDVGAPGGPRDQRWKAGFRTKREAVTAMNELQAQIASGSYIHPSTVTVGEYLTEWLELSRSRLRPGSHDACAFHVHTYLIPRIGDVRLQALTGRRIKRLYAELGINGRVRGGGGLSDKTIHNIHCTLSRALSDAVADRLLACNPAKGAHRQPESPEQQTWTAEELAAFLTFVKDDYWYALWRVLAFTGMRRGEAVGLRRRDLDLENNRLYVVQQRAKGGGTVTTGKTKGRRGRMVTLDTGTVEALRRHLAEQARQRELLGAGYTDEGYVFAHVDGKPIHPDSVTKRFIRLCKLSGLPPLTPHGLRHTHASLLLKDGVHLKVIQERLGHSSIQVTGDVYTHVAPSLQQDAAVRAARILTELANDEDHERGAGGERDQNARRNDEQDEEYRDASA
jgi:integrase